MSILGFYFVKGLLREAGWPRRRGLLRKHVVDAWILDAAVDQMVDWSASIGAARPRLALQLVAEMFRDRDWEGSDAPNIAMVVNESRARWNAVASDSAPHKAVPAVSFAKHYGPSINWKAVANRRICALLEEACLAGLLWGLGNPDRFETWYASWVARYGESVPLMRRMGFAVDEQPPGFHQFIAAGEEIVRRYERDVGGLPPIPTRLMADAAALGRISDE